MTPNKFQKTIKQIMPEAMKKAEEEQAKMIKEYKVKDINDKFDEFCNDYLGLIWCQCVSVKNEEDEKADFYQKKAEKLIAEFHKLLKKEIRWK